MLTPTPDPSGAEILEAAPLVDGRVAVACNELVRRLKIRLPRAVSEFNARWARTGERALSCPRPDKFGLAPAALSDGFVESVLIGATVDTEDYGAETFKNVARVSIHVVRRRIKEATAQRDVMDASDLAGLVRASLWSVLSDCVTLDGVRAWNLLSPVGGVQELPDEANWRDFSGKTCVYLMVQTPDLDLWTPAG